VNANWKSKRVSPVRFEDTNTTLFVHQDVKQNPFRTAKLILEEQRDRPYNIINGRDESMM
jgi:hypothetical protein